MTECCPVRKYALQEAIMEGHLLCFIFLHREYDARLTKDICSCAAGKGDLEILKYAREEGCPWSERTCSNAAFNGHLDCLKWARENG